MSKSISLYDTLNSSYGDKKANSNLEKQGYIKDKQRSNGNQQVYYNPQKKDLMVNVAGSHNLYDFAVNDVALGLGLLKSTDRYKQADKTLKEAKKFYQPNTTIVSGHSLGSSIGKNITSKSDKFVGLDAGYTIGQKTRSNNGNHQNYRTEGDVVSILGSGAKNMKTLKPPKKGILDYALGPLYTAYNRHVDFNNVKKIRVR